MKNYFAKFANFRFFSSETIKQKRKALKRIAISHLSRHLKKMAKYYKKSKFAEGFPVSVMDSDFPLLANFKE